MEAQVAATAAVQEQAKYATALAQWEAEQEARTQERAQQQAAAQATYEAQVADSYAAATAAVAQDLAIRATAQAEQDEARAAEREAQGELMIPVWALVVVGVVALAVVDCYWGLAGAETGPRTNFDTSLRQSGNIWDKTGFQIVISHEQATAAQ